MPNSEQDDIISTTARALAHHVVIMALVRSHPDLQLLRNLAEPRAEATRANLLASNWTDEQVQKFDDSLDLLLNMRTPPSAM